MRGEGRKEGLGKEKVGKFRRKRRKKNILQALC
jgi:hypothetical protein